MHNWVAIVDDGIHYSWAMVKSNGQTMRFSAESLMTDYGLYLPVTHESLNLINWFETREMIPSGEHVNSVAGVLVNSFGEVYFVIQKAMGDFTFRRIPCKKGVVFVTSNTWGTEEIIHTILSYTKDPQEVIAASERVILTNPNLRSYTPVEDLGKIIESIRPSKRLGTLYKVE